MNSAETVRAYTVRACRAHGIGRTRFYDEVNSGRLKVRKLGTRTLVLREDAEAWLSLLPSVPTRPRPPASS